MWRDWSHLLPIMLWVRVSCWGLESFMGRLGHLCEVLEND